MAVQDILVWDPRIRPTECGPRRFLLPPIRPQLRPLYQQLVHYPIGCRPSGIGREYAVQGLSQPGINFSTLDSAVHFQCGTLLAARNRLLQRAGLASGLVVYVQKQSFQRHEREEDRNSRLCASDPSRQLRAWPLMTKRHGRFLGGDRDHPTVNF
jgi:hypothetical protein